jgi:hypothetical protein
MTILKAKPAMRKFSKVLPGRRMWRFGFVELMFGSEASDNPIGGDDIHDIQTHDRGDGLRGGSALVLHAAGDVGVRRPEASEARHAEIHGARMRVAAEDRDASGGLGFDLTSGRPVETGVQSISIRVKCEGLPGTGTHGGLLK